jgi:hypothetical protein
MFYVWNCRTVQQHPHKASTSELSDMTGKIASTSRSFPALAGFQPSLPNEVNLIAIDVDSSNDTKLSA